MTKTGCSSGEILTWSSQGALRIYPLACHLSAFLSLGFWSFVLVSDFESRILNLVRTS